MRSENGFTLLELLIACMLSAVVLVSVSGFALKSFGMFGRYFHMEQERQELAFVAETMREVLWSGEKDAAASAEECIIKDTEGRTLSFYLKDKKVCMYKNAVFYLTTGSFAVLEMTFSYRPDAVRFTLSAGRTYRYYL